MLTNCHHNQDQEVSHYRKYASTPPLSAAFIPLAPAPGGHSSIFCDYRFAFSGIHTEWIIQYMTFWICFLPLSVMHLNSSIVVGMSSPFFFIANNISLHVYTKVYPFSSWKYLGC